MATAYGKVQKGSPTFLEVDDDLYPVKLIKVEDGEGEWEGVKYPQYIATFEFAEVEKDNGEKATIKSFIRVPDGVVNDGVLNENSKLYEFLQALGYDDESMVIDPDEWVGKKLRIFVENKEIAKGQNAGSLRPRVTTYKPVAGKGAATAAKQQTKREPKAAAADDGDDF